jgi:hypothetical protein
MALKSFAVDDGDSFMAARTVERELIQARLPH